jgi:vanillate O-demethylase ferredoxin subunit
LDIAALLRAQDAGTHVYYCGPPGFMAACAAATAHWPAGTVHCEHFKAPAAPPGQAAPDAEAAPDAGTASVEIASTGMRLAIPPGVAVVDVLHEAGIMVDTSCVSGLCGSCRVRYLSGEVDHQDYILSEDDRAEYLTTCVSRPKAGVLVLDL